MPDWSVVAARWPFTKTWALFTPLPYTHGVQYLLTMNTSCVHVYVGFYVDSLGEEGAHMMEGYNRMGVGG